jgi:hypothetical protein
VCAPRIFFTSSALASERTVPRTRKPAARTARMVCWAMKPEAPVTRTQSPAVAAEGVSLVVVIVDHPSRTLFS